MGDTAVSLTLSPHHLFLENNTEKWPLPHLVLEVLYIYIYIYIYIYFFFFYKKIKKKKKESKKNQTDQEEVGKKNRPV